MIPTTSILYFTIINNLIISTISRKEKLSLEEYGKYHPAGSIGKKIWTEIKDIMHDYDNTSIIDLDKTILNCIESMIEKKTSCSIITKDNLYYGFVSGGDIRKYIQNNKDNLDLNNKISLLANTKALTAFNTDKLNFIIKILYIIF